MTSGRKPVVMVVDDEPEICTLLRFVLEKEGYDVTEAGNGQEALDRLASEGMPDLMILDIMMPIMDGFTLNMRLQSDEKTRRIPILVLTAKGQKMRDMFEMAPNVAAYVQKPFDPKMLRELIAGIIAQRDA